MNQPKSFDILTILSLSLFLSGEIPLECGFIGFRIPNEFGEINQNRDKSRVNRPRALMMFIVGAFIKAEERAEGDTAGVSSPVSRPIGYGR
jgi:hypothetical protein